MRVERRLLEIGIDDLTMSERGGRPPARPPSVSSCPTGRIAELVSLTEGWPAALYLAALAIGTGEVASRTALSQPATG